MKTLDQDELEQISKKLTFCPDYTRFRSVCKSWRSSAPKRPQLPWLITSERPDSNTRNSIFKFYQFSFEINKFMEIPELPELSVSPWSSSSSSSPADSEMDCIGYAHGWIALVDRSTLSVSLFNPFTNSSISLPVLENLSDVAFDLKKYCKYNLYLTSDPGESLSNCFALIYCGIIRRFMYCKVGCADWIEMPHPEFKCYREIHVCCYRGKTFIASHGDVFVCNFGCNPITVQKIVSYPRCNICSNSYLIELGGDLLFVIRHYRELEDDSFYYFLILKLDLESQTPKLVELRNLGDKALFLCSRTIFSLTASKYPGCKANHIYSICEYERQKLTIYDFEERGSVVVNDDDAPLNMDWEDCGWFTPSLLKSDVGVQNF